MSYPRFEIGCLYKKKGIGRIFLAISHTKLISVKKGKLTKTAPQAQYKHCNELTFGDLCENWDVSEVRLDEITQEYLPPPVSKRTAPKGSRRRKAADEFFWKELRSAKLPLSALS